jgi:predicted permease
MLVFAAMSLVHDIDPRAIAVLSAAMPMGADVCLVAARYDTYVTRASTAVLPSTVRSVLTVPLLALVLAEAPIVRCCALLARPSLRVR